jgi:hypothetical protein
VVATAAIDGGTVARIIKVRAAKAAFDRDEVGGHPLNGVQWPARPNDPSANRASGTEALADWYERGTVTHHESVASRFDRTSRSGHAASPLAAS